MSDTESSSVARSSAFMALGTISSRGLGFVRAILLAFAIGVTTNAADAFGVANQLPNTVYALIMGGVLNAILVPQLIKARKLSDDGRGYIDRFVTFTITVFFALSVLATLAAPLLVSLYTTGWSSDQLALATAFAYWTIPQLFFYGLYSVFGEVLNSRSKFGPFMWAPVLNNLVSIVGLGLFIFIFSADPEGLRPVQMWGMDRIVLLAGSATAGVIAQSLILLVAWKHIGLYLKLNFKWRGVGFFSSMKAAGWSLAMVVVVQIGALVQINVASSAAAARVDGLAIASVAAYAIAWLIFMLPHSVVTVSVATAYFTRFSKSAGNNELASLRSDMSDGLKIIALLSVLASAGLAVLSYPAARVFSPGFDDAMALGNVLFALSFGLVPFSFVHLMQRGFFAMQNTRIPFVFTTIQIVLHIIGSITLGLTLPATQLVAGIALVTTVSVTVQAILAYVFLKKTIGVFTSADFWLSIAKFIIAVLPAIAVGIVIINYLGGIAPGGYAMAGSLSAVVTILAVTLGMTLSYLFMLRALRVSELGQLRRIISRG